MTPRFLIALSAGFLIAGSLPADTLPVDFARDIAPILRDYCAACHHNEEAENGFSVETYQRLMKGGDEGNPIIPTLPEESLLIRVLTGKAKPAMPPKKEPQLPPQALETLRRWVQEGAKGPATDTSILSTLTVPDLNLTPGNTPGRRPITALAYSPDGSSIALGTYGSVTLHSSPDSPPTLTLGPLTGKVTALHWHQNQLVIATGIPGLQGEALIYEIPSGKRLQTFSGHHSDLLYDAVLSSDGTILASAGYDSTIHLWNTADGSILRSIQGHNGAIFDLAFSPNSQILASASADATIKLWRVEDGERLDTLNQPQKEQFTVEFTPDGAYVLGAGADNRLRLWDLVSQETPAINPILLARFSHEEPLYRIAISPQGNLLASSSSDRTIKLWSLPDLTPLATFDEQTDLATSLQFHPTLPLLTAGRLDGTLSSWPVPSQANPNPPLTPNASPIQQSPLSSEKSLTTEAQVTLNEPQIPTALESPFAIPLPAIIKGAIQKEGESDYFQFEAKSGEEWVFEVNAARSGSSLDSRLEILTAQGQRVEQVLLQAVRDSWFTFRGKDSDTSGDFRLQNWREMELNEYLYSNGEVVKLWLYPRGPDSGFTVYPGFGKRHTYFGTPALSHALGAPCYIVTPHPPGSTLSPNGLPVFPIYFENDDETQQRWGKDSQLFFHTPHAGTYLLKINDVRGFGNSSGFHYEMTARPRKPHFKVSIQGFNPSISPGSGREMTLRAERFDGFTAPIQIDVSELPPGFHITSPIVIEENQYTAYAAVYADENAAKPEDVWNGKVQLTASAKIGGITVTQAAGNLGNLTLGNPAKVHVQIQPLAPSNPQFPTHTGKETNNGPLEFTLAPGETLTALVKANRADFTGRIELGGDDSGRNLPHGVYVDNIGLNGLLIVEGQSERQFFITAAKWVPDTTRYFYLRTTADGGQASRPAILHIRSNAAK